jgi:hypothetical protein
MIAPDLPTGARASCSTRHRTRSRGQVDVLLSNCEPELPVLPMSPDFLVTYVPDRSLVHFTSKMTPDNARFLRSAATRSARCRPSLLPLSSAADMPSGAKSSM